MNEVNKLKDNRLDCFAKSDFMERMKRFLGKFVTTRRVSVVGATSIGSDNDGTE